VARVADGGGGGYEFSPAQIDAAIKKFEDVLEKAKNAGTQLTQAARTLSPPAEDGPSMRQTEGARASLQRAQEHNQALQNYAEGFLRKLHAAKADYQDAEDHNVGNANRQM
ncbi:MAG: PE domain-containing protein, partial [Sciscionella sp.]